MFNFKKCLSSRDMDSGYALRLVKLVTKIALSYPYIMYDTREKGEFEAQRVPD